MKRQYTNPELEVMMLVNADIVTASTDPETTLGQVNSETQEKK